jgi:succinate dehydrogenase/fumarate reductase flavoprotein subunit
MASVPHNYMLGAFTNGSVAGIDAMEFADSHDFADFDASQIALERDRVLAPTRREDGIPPNQIEYKTRRLVNDYLQPPKVTRKYELGMRRLAEVRGPRLALSRGEPLGPLSPAHGFPRERQRELVLPHPAQQ